MALIENYTTGEDESYIESITSSAWLCQTFTIGTVGDNIASIIDSLELKIANTSTGLVYTYIYAVNPSGSPTGSALSSGSASASIFDTGTTGKWGTITMTEYTLQPSTKYALVITADSACSARADGTTPTYDGGDVWYSSDSGASWTEDSTTDIMFQINGGTTDGGTLATFGDVINKLGANANSVAKSPLLLTGFIRTAESKLNVLTRKNWTDIYSTLNEDLKYVLNDAVSSLAAIYGINFGEADNGFTLESQRKIENLRVLANEIIRELKDLDIQEFIVNE